MKQYDIIHLEGREPGVVLLMEKKPKQEDNSSSGCFIENRRLFEEVNDLLTGGHTKIPYMYEGGLVIGCERLEGFCEAVNIAEPCPCFCYKKVVELIFKDGRLTAAMDHSKGMYRIRRNLELGLRDLAKKKDQKIIRKFLKKSFVCGYQKLL